MINTITKAIYKRVYLAYTSTSKSMLKGSEAGTGSRNNRGASVYAS